MGGARNWLCCCEDMTGDLAGGNLAEKKNVEGIGGQFYGKNKNT